MLKQPACGLFLCLLSCQLFTVGNVAFAQRTSAGLRVETQQRYFLEDGPFPEQEREYTSMAAELEFMFSSKRERHRLSAKAFYRHDFDDPNRRQFELKELEVTHLLGPVTLSYGSRTVFWGTAESSNIVDIINQRDLNEDPLSGAKLSQPMLSIAVSGDNGQIEALLMPRFRPREFPSTSGRANIDIPIVQDDARYEHPDGKDHFDFALRFSHAIGSMDFALSYFEGTARSPELLPCLRQGSGLPGTDNDHNCDLDGIGFEISPIEQLLLDLGLGPSPEEIQEQIDAFRALALDNLVLVPLYQQIQQLGFEAQWALDAWLLKLEATRRKQAGAQTSAVVAGVEYTFVGVFGSVIDLGLVTEYLYNQRVETSLSSFQDHLFVASRFEFNDPQTSRVLIGTIDSLMDSSRYFGAQASRRIGQNWRANIESFWLSRAPEGSILERLESEDFVTLTLERFF